MSLFSFPDFSETALSVRSAKNATEVEKATYLGPIGTESFLAQC